MFLLRRFLSQKKKESTPGTELIDCNFKINSNKNFHYNGLQCDKPASQNRRQFRPRPQSCPRTRSQTWQESQSDPRDLQPNTSVYRSWSGLQLWVAVWVSSYSEAWEGVVEVPVFGWRQLFCRRLHRLYWDSKDKTIGVRTGQDGDRRSHADAGQLVWKTRGHGIDQANKRTFEQFKWWRQSETSAAWVRVNI